MPPTVGRIAPALDQPDVLELVEQAHELPLVVAERVGDRALSLVGATVERSQDREVVRVQAALLVGRHRLALGGEAEALEQKRGRLDELRREPVRGMRRA